VAYFGDPDLPEEERVERFTLRSVPVSFVNWSDWTSDKTDHTVAQVGREAKGGRVVIVYSHWGEEYEPTPERVKQLARSFIDAGADIVIGSHPHIVQEHEEYLGKHIYYSLGNFLFDQYWKREVRRGLLIRLTLTPTSILSVEEIPIDNQTDRRMCAV
jgi:poly-gamma-glutamate capsule biosynthesis protein CapA/YwtB (metallophosphatase superfamily)